MFAAESTALEPAAQFEADTQSAPLAQIEPGAIAISSPKERGQWRFEKGAVRVESSAEGAGDAVAKVLQTPSLGNPQLEAAVGVVQFAIAPFAAGYGAITSGHHKLTAAELREAEQQVTEVMNKMVEQDQLRDAVLQYAPEQTHRRLVALDPARTPSADPFSGSLIPRIESLELRPLHQNEKDFQLTIRARARLVKAVNDQVIIERSYSYTSDVALFIDWARAGGLESVARTGFRQIAQDICRDFCSPLPEAPLFLGAGYGNPTAPQARPVRLASRTAPGTARLQYVDYRVTANGALEVFPNAKRAEVMIRGPKVKADNSESETETEWTMDGLENHPNFVVQAGACVAAVPLGIWEQTVAAVSRKSQDELSGASALVQRVVWKTPLQQNLADDIARTLAPQTPQPILLRKMPSTSGEGSSRGDLIRISTGGEMGSAGQVRQIRPDTALEVHINKVELYSTRGSKRRPSLALEAKATLFRTSDGQELHTWPVRYCSARQRIGEWCAQDGAGLEQELRKCSNQIADAVVAQLLREGCVLPGHIADSAIARN